jgi:hypothetical protein
MIAGVRTSCSHHVSMLCKHDNAKSNARYTQKSTDKRKEGNCHAVAKTKQTGQPKAMHRA